MISKKKVKKKLLNHGKKYINIHNTNKKGVEKWRNIT